MHHLGGSIFNLTIGIAEVDDEHQFKVLSTHGNSFLGGGDCDQQVIKDLADEFRREQGLDLPKDQYALQSLKEAAEIAKIELSSTQETNISLPFMAADYKGVGI